jgi:hypothetical protein
MPSTQSGIGFGFLITELREKFNRLSLKEVNLKFFMDIISGAVKLVQAVKKVPVRSKATRANLTTFIWFDFMIDSKVDKTRHLIRDACWGLDRRLRER